MNIAIQEEFQRLCALEGIDPNYLMNEVMSAETKNWYGKIYHFKYKALCELVDLLDRADLDAKNMGFNVSDPNERDARKHLTDYLKHARIFILDYNPGDSKPSQNANDQINESISLPFQTCCFELTGFSFFGIRR